MTGNEVIEGMIGLVALLHAGLWVRMEHRMTLLEDSLAQYRRPKIEALCPDCPLLVHNSRAGTRPPAATAGV